MTVDQPSAGKSGPIEAVAFETANSRAYLSAVFAAWRAGQVVVALPKGSAIGSVPGVSILSRQSFSEDPGWFGEALAPGPAEAPAQIAFSSGTTGRPKALLLSHGGQWDVVRRINTAMEVDETIREYVGVPVTFSFGFGRVRAVAAAGGQSFLPRNGFDPAEIARMLEAGEINAVSAVPTLWRVVLANPGVIGASGAKVRWIEIGSQYMSGAEKADLRRLFPNARIVQHYGLTEASRTTLLDVSRAPEDRLDSVGRAEGDVRIAISEEGAIRIRGPHVAMGRVTGAGPKPVTDDDGWLTTSDRGRIEDGWLYYDGRTDELINCGGVKIDPTQFEQRLVAELGTPGAVAVGRVAEPLRGEQVLVALDQGAGLDRSLVEQNALSVAESFGLVGRGALAFRTVAEIPFTQTGKVRRAALAEMPDLEATPEPASYQTASAPAAADTRAAKLQALWAEILGLPHVSRNESFYDLGGDSLSALTAIMRMETMGLDAETARGIFEGRTIAEITGATGAPATPSAAPLPQAAPVPAPSPPGRTVNARASDLQALWAEILGVAEVSRHESFYDLGGDSLSALTAIMRMEAMGLDAETARGIFEGRTIAEITGASGAAVATSAAPVPQSAPSPAQSAFRGAANGRAAELQALWAEILGVPHVSRHESFYDLGGDSLSALTAVMRMEAMGLDAETARGIFEGRTIAELAGDNTASKDTQTVGLSVPATEPAQAQAAAFDAFGRSETEARDALPGLTLAETMNAVHATRGVLILWVVVVHWLPGVLTRLGDSTLWIYEALIPAWRFGTPGFAMVFGIGIGALGISHYRSNRDMFLKGMRFNTRLVVAGVLLLALFKGGVLLTKDEVNGRLVLSIMFYSAISYYALALLAMPLIMRVLNLGSNRLVAILACGVGAMLIHEVLASMMQDARPSGVLELAKILLTAKYGFFRMTGYVMMGAAAGWLFRRHHATPGLPGAMAAYGLIAIVFGGMMLYYAAPQDVAGSFNLPAPWHMTIYFGVMLLILSGFAVLNRAGAALGGPVVQGLNAFAIATGILALPIFVGHEVVGQAKALFDDLGLPDVVALLLPLGIFFGGLFVGYKRLLRVLYRPRRSTGTEPAMAL